MNAKRALVAAGLVSGLAYRRWYLRWGATDEEVRAPMPGDDEVPRALSCSRALTSLVSLFEAADFVQQYRMLLGIKRRAEG